MKSEPQATETELKFAGADGFAVSVNIPAGMTLGDIVDSFIRIAFVCVADLYGSGATEQLGDGRRNPTVQLFRAENCLRSVWRAIQKGDLKMDVEEVA